MSQQLTSGKKRARPEHCGQIVSVYEGKGWLTIFFMETLRGHCKAFLTTAFIVVLNFALVARWRQGHGTELKRKSTGFHPEAHQLVVIFAGNP